MGVFYFGGDAVLDFAKNFIKARIKRRTIKLLLPVLLPVLVLGIIAMFIMGVVFYVTPEGSLYAKPTVTEEDQELQEKYVELADKYNKIDRWIVSGESSEDDLWYDKVNSNKDDYDNYYNIKNRELMDHYGKDTPLLETFGQIHAASVFRSRGSCHACRLERSLWEMYNYFKWSVRFPVRPLVRNRSKKRRHRCGREGYWFNRKHRQIFRCSSAL